MPDNFAAPFTPNDPGFFDAWKLKPSAAFSGGAEVIAGYCGAGEGADATAKPTGGVEEGAERGWEEGASAFGISWSWGAGAENIAKPSSGAKGRADEKVWYCCGAVQDAGAAKGKEGAKRVLVTSTILVPTTRGPLKGNWMPLSRMRRTSMVPRRRREVSSEVLLRTWSASNSPSRGLIVSSLVEEVLAAPWASRSAMMRSWRTSTYTLIKRKKRKTQKAKKSRRDDVVL
jgi:hypothetical protein